MDISFKPADDNNREELLSLGLLPSQRGYIETVAQCLSEAKNDPRWRPVGIYFEENLIGFAMYGFFEDEYPPEGRLWMDRFLIDSRYQGMGHGREALSALLPYMLAEYPQRPVFLSVTPGNTTAAALYQSFGFRFNGEKDIHGEDVMVKE